MAVRNTGLIDRLYFDRLGCIIRLIGTNSKPEDTPKDGYYRLPLTHPNYQCLYSLALLAADSRRRLSIRTEQEITPSENAQVNYLVLDYPRETLPILEGNTSSPSGSSNTDFNELPTRPGQHAK